MISISEQTGLASVQLDNNSSSHNTSPIRYSHVVQVPISKLSTPQTQVYTHWWVGMVSI